MRRLFEGGAYSSNYCNWQLKSLLHLGQIVITFRTLLHLGQNVITFRTLLNLGSFTTFRPSTQTLYLTRPTSLYRPSNFCLFSREQERASCIGENRHVCNIFFAILRNV